MSPDGVVLRMEHGLRPLSVRHCDFGEARSALEELVGRRAGVEVSPLNGSGPFLTAIGELSSVCEVGRQGWRAMAFDVGDVMVRLAERAFASGSREEYADESGRMRWRVVAVELRHGVVIEVEEIPAGRD